MGDQTRSFLDSLLKSTLGPCPLRSLTHRKVLPYSPSLIFNAVADVAGYPAFLPFTIASQVTAKDAAGYPTRARLKIGYEKLGLEEYWDSIVACDPRRGKVDARSSDQHSNGLFEVLSTQWRIQPLADAATGSALVELDLRVQFRNSVYDRMFSQVEDNVARAMVTAFEKRAEELHSRE